VRRLGRLFCFAREEFVGFLSLLLGVADNARPKLAQLLDQLRSAIAPSLPSPILLGAIVLSMSLIERGRETLMASSRLAPGR
jgi:hypothetical protein